MKYFYIILIFITSMLPVGCSSQYKLKKYVKLYAMPYAMTKQNVGKDRLPQLHRMLKDKKYAPYWHNIARIIGYVSDDPNSVFVLLNYFQRDDSWNLDTDIKISGKINSISYMGYIGGRPADVIMRGCTSSQGAAELAKNWINKILEVDGPSYQVEENIINKIRYAALIGLARTGTKENAAFITNLYEQECAYCETNKVRTRFFSALADAMAMQEYIVKNGIEAYKNILSDGLINDEEISGLIGKYSRLSWVEKLKSERL